MKLTKYGRREWLGATIAAAALILLLLGLVLAETVSWIGFVPSALFIGLVWFCIAGFFRDPCRKIPEDDSLVLSPADGVVHDIETIPAGNLDSEQLRSLFQGREVIRIGIFLSVFNVHVNRAPVKLNARFLEYRKGAFHDARDGRASRENESMLLGAEGSMRGIRFPVAVKQISGAIARRIVCPVKPGDVMDAGFRYGMIKFGSRTELFLPADIGLEIKVKTGQAVAAGTSTMAELSPKPQA